MGKQFLVFVLMVLSVEARAQRFFYIDPADKGSQYFLVNLKNASQYISKTAIGSDCTVKTETIVTSFKTVIRITLQDSTTLKTIFESAEEYSYHPNKITSDKLQDLYLKIFAERYTDKLVACEKRNNLNYLLSLLKEKKDKT